MKINKEVFSLYIIQFSNMVIPLLVFPYLTKVLGVSGVGKLGFALTIYMIFTFIIDFGFNLTGARTISILDKKNKDFSFVYTNIIVFKIFIYTVLLLVSLLIINLNFLKIADKEILIIVLLASFGNLLIPNFLFNALNINSILAKITLIIRILFLIPMFIFVRNENDIVFAILLQIIPNFFAGIASQAYIFKRKIAVFSLSFYNLNSCLAYAKEAYHNFSASAFTLGFTYSIPLLVKFFLGDYALGVYTLVDKLINILRQLYVPIIQAFYAKVCISYEEKNWKEYKQYLRKISIIFAFIGGSALLSNFLLGEWILKLIFGEIENLKYFVSLAIINQVIISIAIILVNFNILVSNNGYILKRIYAFGLLFFSSIFYFLQYKFQLSGFFYSMIITELLLTFTFFLFIFYKFKEKFVKKV